MRLSKLRDKSVMIRKHRILSKTIIYMYDRKIRDAFRKSSAALNIGCLPRNTGCLQLAIVIMTTSNRKHPICPDGIRYFPVISDVFQNLPSEAHYLPKSICLLYINRSQDTYNFYVGRAMYEVNRQTYPDPLYVNCVGIRFIIS